MSDLAQQHCKACEGGVDALTPDYARALLAHVKNWTINDTATEIQREFKFKNYYETMAFVNATAWVSHKEDHHPDIEVSYNRCVVRYTTHAIKGLSENDFICAAKIDALVASR